MELTYVTGHFHVVENTPGYLPDDDEPAIFATKEDAIEYATDRVMDYWDMDDEDDPAYTFSGSQGVDIDTVDYENTRTHIRQFFEQEQFVIIHDKTKTYDLGRVVEITFCIDTECEVPDNE